MCPDSAPGGDRQLGGAGRRDQPAHAHAGHEAVAGESRAVGRAGERPAERSPPPRTRASNAGRRLEPASSCSSASWTVSPTAPITRPASPVAPAAGFTLASASGASGRGAYGSGGALAARKRLAGRERVPAPARRSHRGSAPRAEWPVCGTRNQLRPRDPLGHPASPRAERCAGRTPRSEPGSGSSRADRCRTREPSARRGQYRHSSTCEAARARSGPTGSNAAGGNDASWRRAAARRASGSVLERAHGHRFSSHCVDHVERRIDLARRVRRRTAGAAELEPEQRRGIAVPAHRRCRGEAPRGCSSRRRSPTASAAVRAGRRRPRARRPARRTSARGAWSY